MDTLQLLFWGLLILIVYTYIGYGLLLYLLSSLKSRFWQREIKVNVDELPSLTLVIAAYNEMEYLEKKVNNCLELLYPASQFNLIFVTDGSNDGSALFLEQYDQVKIYHSAERKGKMAAINRVMPDVTTDIVVFSDANAMLNKDALLNLVQHFNDPKVGCVAGEKRISIEGKNKAATAGEGLYWKYESKLKDLSYQLHSAIGAAGELFAIRTMLFETPQADTILDDFIISLSVVPKGFKIAYAPNAYAIESGSLTIKEEMKRKVRICAGGVQAILRTLPLLNPIKYPIFAFQYLSHRCLRWVVVPFLLVLLIPLHIYLAYENGGIYHILGIFHLMFYLSGGFGYFLKQRQIKNKFLFIPFYFLMMNISALLGMKKFILKQQSILWEKSKRLEVKLQK